MLKSSARSHDLGFALGARSRARSEESPQDKQRAAELIADNLDRHVARVEAAVARISETAAVRDRDGYLAAKKSAQLGVRDLEWIVRTATAAGRDASPIIAERLAAAPALLERATALVASAPAIAEEEAPVLTCEAALLAALPPDEPVDRNAREVFDTARAEVARVLWTEATVVDLAALGMLLRDHAGHEVTRRFRRFSSHKQQELLAVLADPRVKMRARSRTPIARTPAVVAMPAPPIAPPEPLKTAEPIRSAPTRIAPPVSKTSKRERLEAGRWKFAFFFVSKSDDYGKHARTYFETYYPDHARFTATSFEHMFQILARENTKLEQARDRHDANLDELYGDSFIEEIVLVSHGTSLGSMQIPLTKGDARIFTPWDVAELQQEVSEGEHARFQKRRTAALTGITTDTRIVVRGCEVGDSPGALDALRVLFGGEPTVFAPRHFQMFQVHEIGGPLLKTWRDALAHLLKHEYVPAELADADEKTQRAYIAKHFGDGVPTEFFVVSADDKAKLEALEQDDRAMTAEAEPLKQYSDEDARDPDRADADWAVIEGQPAPPGAEGSLTADELVAEAESIIAGYTPQQGARFIALYEAWQRLQPTLPRRIEVDPEQIIPEMPGVFETANLARASNDAARFPAASYDEFTESQLLCSQTMQVADVCEYERPGADVVAAAHDFTQSHRLTAMGPKQAKSKGDPTRRKHRRLVRTLLAAIDREARLGLDTISDTDQAGQHARLAAQRLQHLISITALPGDVESSLAQFGGKAAIALGHAEALAINLESLEPASGGILRDALDHVATVVAPSAKWSWIAHVDSATAGKYRRSDAIRVGLDTLVMVRHRISSVLGSSDPAPILATAAAVHEDVAHAGRELALAIGDREPAKDTIAGVREAAVAIEKLEAVAWALGAGQSPQIAAMVGGKSVLLAQVGLGEPAPELRALPDTTPEDDAQFLFTVEHYIPIMLVQGAGAPEQVRQGVPVLDELAEKLRSVIILLSDPERGTHRIERAVDLYLAIQPRIEAVFARAASRLEGADQVSDTRAALDRLETWMPQIRAADLYEQQLAVTEIGDPESGFYEVTEAPIQEALSQTKGMFDKAADAIVRLGVEDIDKTATPGINAALDSFNAIRSLYDIATFPERLREAKKRGLLPTAATTAEFVGLTLSVIKDAGNVVHQVFAMHANAKAAQIGKELLAAKPMEDVVRNAYIARQNAWRDVARSYQRFEFADTKLSPVQYMNAALGVIQVVVGILQLVDAIQRDDERAAVSAGATIVQGGAAIGGALLNLGSGPQAGIAGIIFLWWVFIDAAGTLGGHLAGMTRNRKLDAVVALVEEASTVATLGKEMAAAWEAMNEAHARPLPGGMMHLQIAAELEQRAMVKAKVVEEQGLAALRGHFGSTSEDRIGGHRDLAERFGPKAKEALDEVSFGPNPMQLTTRCQTIFAGIDRLARYAMHANGPTRADAESKRAVERIDSSIEAERDKE